MNTRTVEFMQKDEQLQLLLKYGASGGKENRGILTQVKARELPDEPVNVFSNAPAEFEERSHMLWDDTQKLYYHACKANRFSENYLKYSEELEKSIRQMGSICITKAALEQKGLEFPGLSELGIEELVRMVSYHLRKAHAALEGIYKDNDLLGLSYLKQEFRWDALISRLQATEVKIQKIKDGRLNADELLKQDENFHGLPQTNENCGSEVTQRVQVNPSALPIDGAMARNMFSREKAAEKQAEAFRKEKQRKLKELEKLERKLDRTPGAYKPPMIELSKDQKRHINESNAGHLRKEIAEMEASEQEKKTKTTVPVPEKPAPGEISEAEARKILIDDAMRRGDQKALMEIPLEDTAKIYQRWLRYCSNLHENNDPPRIGPSNEKRRALREKRKKRH